MTTNAKKPKIMVENISCILPQQSQLGGLFLGNVYGAQNPTILKQYGIRAVLTSSIETDIEFSFKDVPFHMRISAHDKENYNIKQHLNQCINFIEQSRQLTNVYVHCFAGVSRSAAIVCAYIMWKLKWNFETTIAFVKAKRIVANPNEGFVRQLMQIQNFLLGMVDERDVNGYGNSVSGRLENDQNSLTGAQVPLLTQKMVKQTQLQNQTHQNAGKNSTKIFNSTFSINQFDRLSLQQQQHQQPLVTNYHTPYDQQFSNQYYVPTNTTNNHNKLEQNLYNYGKDNLNYVDSQKISKSINSTEKISTDNGNFQKTASSDHSNSNQNNKFTYLQNFFPQNHTVKNQLQKPKARISSTMSSTSNDLDQSHEKPGSVRKSLKKLQNTQVINGTHTQKQTAIYHIPKQSTTINNNNHHLILGGGKKPQTPLNNNYNHNSIPIPNIKQRSLNKNKSQYQNLNQTTFQPSQIYQTGNSVYNNRNSTDSFSTQYSSRINGNNNRRNVVMNKSKDVVIMASPRSNQQQHQGYLKYDQTKQRNTGLKTPTASLNLNHFTNPKYDFRNSAPNQGFFTNAKMPQPKSDLSKTSRLVKPKDLPGYKNY